MKVIGIVPAILATVLAVLPHSLARAGTPADGAWEELPPPARGGASAILDPIRDRMIVFGGRDDFARGETWALSLQDSTWTLLTANGPAPRTDHTAIYDPDGDRMIVLGGNPVQDLWQLSLSSTPTWSPLVVSGTPGGIGHTAIYDSVGKRMIVFGGVPGVANVWELTLTGTPVWTQLTPGPGPVGRWDHVAIYDPLRQRMIVYGGWSGSDPTLDDVWELSLSGPLAWQQIFTVGRTPGGLRSATAVYDPFGDRMVVTGGTDDDSTWALPLSGVPSWVNLGPPGARPFRRADHVAVVDRSRSRMLIQGGSGFRRFNDTWAFELDGLPAWQRVTPAAETPNWRVRHTSIIDPIRDRMLVIGGSTGGFTEPKFWSLSLAEPQTWTPFAPLGTAPSPRTGTSVIYDPMRDRMIVFGGQTGSTTDKANDLWALSLQEAPAWAPLAATGTPPAARGFHSAVYDPALDRMIVFGGEDGGSIALNDAWQLTLRGTPVWSPLSPSGFIPTARYAHQAFYDSPRGRMVIHGGRSQGGTDLNDAWALTLGAAPDWTLLTPNGSAPARGFQPGFYDPVRDRFVVTGGLQGTDWLDDLRALSLGGTPAWTTMAPANAAPANRMEGSAAYDPLRDRAIVFGGGLPTVTTSTWALAFGDLPPGPPTVACPGDVIWTPGSSTGVLYDVTNPFGFADSIDYVLTSEREWPGFPIHGRAPAPAQDHAIVSIQVPVPDTAANGLNILVFRGWLRRSGTVVMCNHHIHDATTPIFLSLVEARAEPDHVTLRWFGEGAAGRSSVQRREPAKEWQSLGEAASDGRGGYEYVDRGIAPGARYAYRLRLEGADEEIVSGETWIEVPMAPTLALHGAQPNPAHAITVRFTLPGHGPATLELLDLAGRLVARKRVDDLGPGTHSIPLGRGARLSPGVYVIRLAGYGRRLTARAVVLR